MGGLNKCNICDVFRYGGHPLVEPPGFCFCWAGARCTHGICRGKVSCISYTLYIGPDKRKILGIKL